MTPRNEVPKAAEFGQLVAFLARQHGMNAQVARQHGMNAQVARNVIGNAPAGRTRAQIADTLREWLATRPKA